MPGKKQNQVGHWPRKGDQRIFPRGPGFAHDIKTFPAEADFFDLHADSERRDQMRCLMQRHRQDSKKQAPKDGEKPLQAQCVHASPVQPVRCN